MQRILYIDREALDSLEPIKPATLDPAVEQAVNRALQKLDRDLRLLMHARFYRGLTFSEIASEGRVSRESVIARYYETQRQLRSHLSGFVEKRWGINSTPPCRICGHKKRKVIEFMLKRKSDDESWGSFTRRLEGAIGETIHPPQVFIAHKKHASAKSLPARRSNAS